MIKADSENKTQNLTQNSTPLTTPPYHTSLTYITAIQEGSGYAYDDSYCKFARGSMYKRDIRRRGSVKSLDYNLGFILG